MAIKAVVNKRPEEVYGEKPSDKELHLLQALLHLLLYTGYMKNESLGKIGGLLFTSAATQTNKVPANMHMN